MLFYTYYGAKVIFFSQIHKLQLAFNTSLRVFGEQTYAFPLQIALRATFFSCFSANANHPIKKITIFATSLGRAVGIPHDNFRKN